ncbi:hypothetical protein Q8F55_000394 [Vanrija albida]|uniref:Zn(2)-C6 fungal-type domain-containing protein n=1 Tax=Vanrija albida TaxID=181172 RepID=A0ABR3QDB3_9TREE
MPPAASNSSAANASGASAGGAKSTSTSSATATNSSTANPPRPPRKLNRSANQLHRNQACLPCRRRRIKCDAGRPHCASCVRSFRFLARTQPDPERDSQGIQCQYEDGDEGEGDDGMSSQNEDPREAVRKLEARITELQTTLAQMTTPGGEGPPRPGDDDLGWASSAQAQPHPSASTLDIQRTNGVPDFLDVNNMRDPEPPTYVSGLTGIPGVAQVPLLSSRHNGPASEAPDQHAMLVDLGFSGFVSHPPDVQPNATAPAVSTVIDDDAGKVGGAFLDIIWPGWPPRLPTPAMLEHLVGTFFTMVPSISRILHRKSFMARLALPPTHANFPHTGLLHAICAVTARYSAAVYTISVEESMTQTNARLHGLYKRPAGMSADEEATSQACFGERHAAFARLELRPGEATGRKLLEICQAQTILITFYQQHAKWIDGWGMTGQATRFCVPLGLLQDTKVRGHVRNAIIPPYQEDWDREERRILMSYIFCQDFMCSATSGWPNALALDEVMSRLPAGREDFDRGSEVPENPQTWHSPDLYTTHPVADPFVIFAKGLHLLGQIIKFRRKCQALPDVMRAYNTPLFKKLDNDVTAFRFSFPSSLRDPLRTFNNAKGIDADLVSAHLIPHIAAINLHEPFADVTNPQDPASNRILGEARACLSLVYLLASTALDFSYVLSPVNSFYFFAACRTFVLFYQRALEIRDLQAAKLLLSEIDVFRMTFASMGKRFPLGARHGGMIDKMLQECHAELAVEPEAVRDDGLALGAIALPEVDLRQHQAFPFDRSADYDLEGKRLNGSSPDSLGTLPYEPTGRPELVMDRNHPFSLLFLTPGTTLREKVDQSRGRAPSNKSSPSTHSITTPEQIYSMPPDQITAPTLFPPSVSDPGAFGWLQFVPPTTTLSSNLSSSSSLTPEEQLSAPGSV